MSNNAQLGLLIAAETSVYSNLVNSTTDCYRQVHVSTCKRLFYKVYRGAVIDSPGMFCSGHRTTTYRRGLYIGL